LLDSGGFTELSKYGRYKVSLDEYVGVIQRLDPVGAFCQDWMCEEKVMRKTGSNIRVHQWNTLGGFLELEQKVGDKALPVLQGYKRDDYLRHLEDYVRAGVGFERLFGLGSVCRRSKTSIPESIICSLREACPEIKLHGFGLKITAFKRPLVINNLHSADSMAWSLNRRLKSGKIERGTLIGKNGKKSWEIALEWREKVMEGVEKTKNIERYQGKIANF
jgi:hypothetical protein